MFRNIIFIFINLYSMNPGYHRRLVKRLIKVLRIKHKILAEDSHRIIFCLGIEELIIVKHLKDGFFTAYFCKDGMLQYVFRSERIWINQVQAYFIVILRQRINKSLSKLLDEQISGF